MHVQKTGLLIELKCYHVLFKIATLSRHVKCKQLKMYNCSFNLRRSKFSNVILIFIWTPLSHSERWNSWNLLKMSSKLKNFLSWDDDIDLDLV